MPNLIEYDRNGPVALTSKYDKHVILPAPECRDLATIAWADARFAVDTMMEHCMFIAQMIPPEINADLRNEAQSYYATFVTLLKQIDSLGIPKHEDIAPFCVEVISAIRPLIDFKQRLYDLQVSGRLRSFMWPLFIEHIKDEAERWCRCLEQRSAHNLEYSYSEVTSFWSDIMEEHAEFMGHLLDPTEKVLIDTCTKTAQLWNRIHTQPPVIGTPEAATVPQALDSIIDFKTSAVRGIEGATIRSIIDPRLADHVRREAVKFRDELRRAV